MHNAEKKGKMKKMEKDKRNNKCFEKSFHFW